MRIAINPKNNEEFIEAIRITKETKNDITEFAVIYKGQILKAWYTPLFEIPVINMGQSIFSEKLEKKIHKYLYKNGYKRINKLMFQFPTIGF